ncbi:MAG: BspA family leucine-rich repeat surface protein [Ruminococcus sp.]|nr:BspA family leucine-rich repeat surface protein [Ruminococcus sp.]
MKKTFKKTIAAAMALLIVAGAAPFEPGTFSFIPKPSVTAEAANGVEFNETTGVLTLSGSFSSSEVQKYAKNENVKTVIADSSAVFPSYCFNLFQNFYCTSIDISQADTSKLIDMSGLFKGCKNATSIKISGCDLKKVKTFKSLFSGCSALETVDFTGCSTSSALTTVNSMFSGCSALTAVKSLNALTTTGVTDFNGMFSSCASLPSIDLSELNTENALSMDAMFSGCNSFASIDLRYINSSNVTSMQSMFSYCTGLTYLDLTGLNTAKVTNMSSMFSGCDALTSIKFPSNFDTSKVENMSSMFYNCKALASVDLSMFNTSNVTRMDYMFENCYKLADIDLSNFDTSKVVTMSQMFNSCYALTDLDLSSFDTYNVTDMMHMFNSCSKLTSLKVPFDTHNVKNMAYMFQGCSSITSLDLSTFDTSNVTDMRYMFEYCKSLTNVTFGTRFDTRKVTNMSYMFYYCWKLKTLDLSRFDTKNVSKMDHMFAVCDNLRTVYASELWSNEAALGPNGNSTQMFGGCRFLTGGSGFAHDSKKIDCNYANFGEEGYFTKGTANFPIKVGGERVTTDNRENIYSNGPDHVYYDYDSNTLYIPCDVEVPVSDGNAELIYAEDSLNICFSSGDGQRTVTASGETGSKTLMNINCNYRTINITGHDAVIPEDNSTNLDAVGWDISITGKNNTVDINSFTSFSSGRLASLSGDDSGNKLSFTDMEADIAGDVYGFDGGLTFNGCAVAAPLNATVSGGSILKDGSPASDVRIRKDTACYGVLSTASVVFGGALGLNYKVKLSDTLKDSDAVYALMTVNGREKKICVKDLTPDSSGFYTFTCPVYSTEMRDDICFTLYYGDNKTELLTSKGKTADNGEFHYSVADYLTAVTQLEGTGYAKIRALASATLDYGAAAQIRFDHNAEGVALSKEVVDLIFSDIDKYTISTTAKDKRPSGVTASMSVEFGEDNTLFITYTLPSGKTTNDYKFYIDSKVVTPKSLGSNMYRLEVKNISPDNLAKNHIFNCKEKSTSKSFRAELNVLSYANAVAKSSMNANDIDLAKAMYLYYYAAADYTGKLPQ